MTDERMYLNTVEAGRYLGLSHRTLRRYRVTGEGPLYYRLGGRVRYRRDDLDAWAAKRQEASTSDPGPGPGAGDGDGDGPRPC